MGTRPTSPSRRCPQRLATVLRISKKDEEYRCRSRSYLKAQLSSYRDDALSAIERVVDSQSFIMGEEVSRFEAHLAEFAGVAHARGVSSGTDALLAALMALDVGPGDEVITSPFTFFATAGVIHRLGARPVFVDIDPRTFNMTEAGTRAAITSRTKAIIPVHLYGQVCDLGSLYSDPNRPPIIEDAAQALGAKLHGRMTGHWGDCSCVSFFPSKIWGIRDGGAVLVNDEALAERIHIMRLHGSKPKYHHHFVGGNFRLDAIQAAVLDVKLPLLNGWADARRANAGLYNELFLESGLVEHGLVSTPIESPNAHHVYNQYVLRVSKRDELKAHLQEQGIGSMIYYPRPLHLQPCFRELGYEKGDFPHAERACEDVLAIPVYPELPDGAQQHIVETIRSFYL